MTEQRTLGEQKTALCAQCQTPFVMRRYDHRFCCHAHATQFHNALHVWRDRPDREWKNEKRKERYYANREAELEKHRTKRRECPEEVRAKDREEYRRNKEKHAERAKAYRLAHPRPRRGEYERKKLHTPWKGCLENARNRSLKKRFAFDLTREWCAKTYTGYCAVTKLPFYFGTQTHFPFSPSIDRIDSSKGYTQDNCRFVLFAVNSLKGIGTDEDMLAIAKAIADQN